MGGSPVYVFRDGARLTPWMLYVITVLDSDLWRAFGVRILVTSAIRTYAEQEAIFRSRYVTAGNVNGRRVYDTRVWRGVRWYRVSSAGTVAVPGSSNHEIQGDKAAVDLRDNGYGAGITVASSARGRWIRQWCRSKGMLVATGDSFGEGWHFDVPDIFRTPPAPPSPTPIPPIISKRRKPMSNGVIYTDDKSDSKRSGAIVNYEAGTFDPFGWFDIAYVNNVAVGFGLERAAKVTRGHYDAIRRTISARAAAMGKVLVDLDDKDIPKIGIDEA